MLLWIITSEYERNMISINNAEYSKQKSTCMVWDFPKHTRTFYRIVKIQIARQSIYSITIFLCHHIKL